MKKTIKTTNTTKLLADKRFIIAGGVTLTVALVTVLLYLFVFKSDNEKAQTVTKDNKGTTSNTKTGEDKEVITATEDEELSGLQEDQTPNLGQNSDAVAPADDSNASTNLNRPEVRSAVTSVLAVYEDYLAKMKATPQSQRQAVANQYLVDYNDMFGPVFDPAVKTFGLHLFPQAANVQLPYSVSVKSAIIDPQDPSQTIVQIIMPPDPTWGLHVYVKMNNDGTLGTIERVSMQNDQNAL
jgi:hypothetical protein